MISSCCSCLRDCWSKPATSSTEEKEDSITTEETSSLTTEETSCFPVISPFSSSRSFSSPGLQGYLTPPEEESNQYFFPSPLQLTPPAIHHSIFDFCLTHSYQREAPKNNETLKTTQYGAYTLLFAPRECTLKAR